MNSTTAIVLIDMQTMFRNDAARAALGWPPIWNLSTIVGEIKEMLDYARDHGIPIIYTRQVDRQDGADSMPNYRRLREHLAPIDHGDALEFMPEIAPKEGDVVIDKPRWDAFRYTYLEAILRNLNVGRVVVAGIQTNVCVESTVRTAMMMNFEVAVPLDAVTSDDQQLHTNAINSMRVLYVEVAPWRELLAPDAPWDRAIRTPNYGRASLTQ